MILFRLKSLDCCVSMTPFYSDHAFTPTICVHVNIATDQLNQYASLMGISLVKRYHSHSSETWMRHVNITHDNDNSLSGFERHKTIWNTSLKCCMQHHTSQDWYFNVVYSHWAKTAEVLPKKPKLLCWQRGKCWIINRIFPRLHDSERKKKSN